MARDFETSQVQETKEWLMKATSEGRTPFSTSPEVWQGFPTVPPDWPANELAPPIDTMLTDFDSRLWVRDFQLPSQDSLMWRVWDINRERLAKVGIAKESTEWIVRTHCSTREETWCCCTD